MRVCLLFLFLISCQNINENNSEKTSIVKNKDHTKSIELTNFLNTFSEFLNDNTNDPNIFFTDSAYVEFSSFTRLKSNAFDSIAENIRLKKYHINKFEDFFIVSFGPPNPITGTSFGYFYIKKLNTKLIIFSVRKGK